MTAYYTRADYQSPSQYAPMYVARKGGDCASAQPPEAYDASAAPFYRLLYNNGLIWASGMRILIASDEALCATLGSGFVSGYKP